MNKYFLYNGAFAAVCASALLPLGQSAYAADASAPSVAGGLPINLIHGNLGTRLQARESKAKDSSEKGTMSENDSAQALVSDDAALTYPLKAGATSLLFTLDRIQALSHFNFVNFDAAGKYTVSISRTKLDFDATGWKVVAHGEAFDAAQVVASDLGSVEARYVKVDFQTERAGRISGMGLFGAPLISSYQSKPLGYAHVSGSPGIGSSEGRNVYFDLASLKTGAKVVAVSRGGDLAAAQAILDGNVESNYTFDASDPAPTVVVDLGARRVINRLSCVYEAPAGRLDFYLVDNPYKQDEQHATLAYVDSPSLEPVSNPAGGDSNRVGPRGRQAIYSVNTSAQPGLNRLATDMSGQEGRFLVAEFHPTGGDFKDFKDYKDQPDFKDFKDRPAAASPGSRPVRVLSLSAFGQVPGSEVVPQIPPSNPSNPTNPSVQPPIFPGGEPARAVTP